MKKLLYILLLTSFILKNHAMEHDKENKMSNQDYYNEMIQLHKIIESTRIQCKKSDSALEFMKDNFFDPERQTKKGMYLEIQFGRLWSIIFPLGKWRFVHDVSIKGNGDKDLIQELQNQEIIEFESKKGRTLRSSFDSGKQSNITEVIPNQETCLYKILKASKTLPTPCFKITPEERRKIWLELNKEK